MYAQLRVYTVNRGKLEGWLKFFDEKVRPAAEEAGQTIAGTWVNEAKTEFIWIRTYQDAEDAKVKDAAFGNSPLWKAAAPQAAEFIAKIEVTAMTTP